MARAPFCLNPDELLDETKEIARVELRETDEVKAAALTRLRELLAENTDLHYDTDDEVLLWYLRPTHFYPESALKLMRGIAEFRKTHSDTLTGLTPEMVKVQFTEHEIVNVMTTKDHRGRRILIVNVGKKWNTSKVTAEDMFRMFYLIHQAALLEQETQVRGCVVIMDFNGMGLRQAGALTPASSRRLLSFIQYAMPIRLKEVHIVRQPRIFGMVWKIFTPFIEEKLNKRIHFHGTDWKALNKFVPASHLPQEYGGELPEINYGGKDWYPCVNDYVDHIARLNTFGYATKK